MPSSELSVQEFEALLSKLCQKLTAECQAGKKFAKSATFELRVREVLQGLVSSYGLKVDFEPHPYIFPDIVLKKFGVEVKFTTNDTWRSVANSVFESTRSPKVQHIYVVFGKMGGAPSVAWGKYDECVIHVRTSHVPRFEVELPEKGIERRASLFKIFGVSYADFCKLSIHKRMEHVRKYARSRLKKGERLWWLEDRSEQEHTLPLQVRLYSQLSLEKQKQYKAEAALLCPQIVGSSRNRSKYNDALMYLMTYRGVMATRDTFSAGSAVGAKRGGIYVQRALKKVEPEMLKAAEYLEGALFVEYWGESVPPNKRIQEWLKRADEYAKKHNPPWTPSEVLFLKKS